MANPTLLDALDAALGYIGEARKTSDAQLRNKLLGHAEKVLEDLRKDS